MDETEGLSSRISRGGVYYNLEGDDPVAVLREIVRSVNLPKYVDRETLLQAVLDRETLMPTAMGDGIAFPHPRQPLLTDEGEELVAVCFPRRPVPYAALDRRPVFALFLILSAGTRTHLMTLSELSFLCRRTDFREYLSGKPSREELTGWISRQEDAWRRT